MDDPQATLMLVWLAMFFVIIVFGLVVARLVERRGEKQSIELQR